MPVSGVVGDEVEQEPDSARVGGIDQCVEVLEGPEKRVDVTVVGDVVAEIGRGEGKIGDSHMASTPSQAR